MTLQWPERAERALSIPNQQQRLSTGNGPSAITLSYLLAGNWPYYVPRVGAAADGVIPDYLHRKLAAEPATSILEHDLEYLSEVSCTHW